MIILIDSKPLWQHVFGMCQNRTFKPHSHLRIILRKVLRRAKCSFINLRLCKIYAKVATRMRFPNDFALFVSLCVTFFCEQKILKEKKNIAQSRSKCIRLNILFGYFS